MFLPKPASPDEQEAVRSLRTRRDKDYTDVLLAGLKYPWPAVAERSSQAIVELGRSARHVKVLGSYALAERPKPAAK